MANLQKIKELAELRKISIRELADRIGVKENQIHVMCRTNSTKIDTLEKIADALGVPTTYFFEEKVTEEYNTPGGVGKNLGRVEIKNDMATTAAPAAKATQPLTCDNGNKPTYEDLEQQVRQLQQELLDARGEIIRLMKEKDK